MQMSHERKTDSAMKGSLVICESGVHGMAVEKEGLRKDEY